jgi:hypothetical protein
MQVVHLAKVPRRSNIVALRSKPISTFYTRMAHLLGFELILLSMKA